MTPAQFSDTFPHNAEYPGFRLSLFPKPPSSFVHSAECYWKQQTKAKQQRCLLDTQAPLVVHQRDVVSSCLRTSQFFSLINLAAATLSAHGTSMCHVIVSYFYTGWQVRQKWPNTGKRKKIMQNLNTQTHQTNATEKWQKHIKPGYKVTQNSPPKTQARNTSFKTTEEQWPLGGLDLLYQSRGSSPYLKDMGGMLGWKFSSFL